MPSRNEAARRAAEASDQNSAASPAFSVSQRDIVIPTPDGFPLAGTLFEGAGNKPLVLISSATAVPRGLYAAFARASVEAGARAALIYDYRGTGGSTRPNGWKKRIDMKDWALLDLPAAAASLDAVAPSREMVGVGQSFGGQALGLCGISGRFRRYGMVATMSGYLKNLNDPWAGPRMTLVGVPLSFLFAEMPRWMGLGEPIPASVFRDWARWCRHPDYFFGDASFAETARYRNVRTPILTLGLTDDIWGTPKAVAALMKHYENAPIEERWISPDDAGGQKIGHLGFFRSRFADVLWPEFIGWLLDGTPVTLGERRSA